MYRKLCQYHYIDGKESACQSSRHGFDPWVVKIPWRRKWQLNLISSSINKDDTGNSLAVVRAWHFHC